MTHLVFFIHGLTGNSSTFKEFSDLINQDHQLKSIVNVDHWEYPTNLISFPIIKTSPRIQDIADSLYTELEHRSEKSVFLICHSLGGIIARRMLLDNVKTGRLSKIDHLFLYAVPNNGAEIAKLAGSISFWQPQIRQLSPLSDFIDNLNTDWAFEKMESKTPITYIAGAIDNIVPINSAKSFWGNTRVKTIPDGDHSNIIKPSSLNDIRYKVFQKVILDTLKVKTEKSVMKQSASHILTCIIIDDDYISRKSLQRLCEQHDSLELVSVFDNAVSALEFMENNQVDLIWLDVEMPEISGFDLLDKLTCIPYIILTTVSKDYAYAAFQYDVVDFLKNRLLYLALKQLWQKLLHEQQTVKSLAYRR